jgi:dihydroorotate dehydrogenase electron transfer subunit
MTKFIRDLEVIENKSVAKGFNVLTVSTGMPSVVVKPGQFLQLKIEGSDTTFLRRPFSVHDYDQNTGLLRMLVQVVGPGSMKVSELKCGDRINALFPLGNSFTMPVKGERVLLVGGGCGVAPLLFLGREIGKTGIEPDFLMGFRTRENILEYNEYTSLGKVYLTTEDGSAGEKGYVTDHSILKSNTYDRIYCCGPDPMMKAVGKYAALKETDCEVSLENLMACGFGVCLCCVVPTIQGNLCSCTDGPVFNIKELRW